MIEGACRHHVKDRMGRAGMRWTKAGAEAILEMRGMLLRGLWTNAYRRILNVRSDCEFRIPERNDRDPMGIAL